MKTLSNFKNITWFAWKPNIDLLVIVVTWLLVVGFLSTATFIVTGQRGGLYFITYALLGATVSGVILPVLWTIIIRHRKLSDLGVTFNNLSLLIVAQVIISAVMYSQVLFSHLPPFSTFLPLVALALAIGFFEAIYWRGFILLRLEEMFGLIPALIFGSFLYAVYHVGYGMPVGEMTFLFFIGLMFAVAFRLTKSIFILWPFFQPLGQLTTLLKDGGVGVELPTIAILGFIETLAVMMVLTFLSPLIAKKLNNKLPQLIPIKQ